MELQSVFARGAVSTDLKAGDRDGAVRELLGMLVANGGLGEDLLEPAFEALRRREMLGSTAIGNGVAVPHARLEGLDGTIVAFGLSREGLAFSALDGGKVHEVFLIIAPEGETEGYLEIMRRVSNLVQNRDFRRFMMQARGEEEVLDLIREMDT